MGKSTTGNKLIGSKENKKYAYQTFYSKPTMLLNNTVSEDDIEINKIEFQEGDSIQSTTTTCQLIANKDLKICVLDVKGFSDSYTTLENGVYLGNLQIVRDVLRVQQDQNITFNRILYFLPCRGIPEKIDGYLQEELRVLHYFFGKNIFQCMVIVLTNNPLENLALHLDDSSVEFAKKVFVEGVKESCKLTLDKCPPIVHININDSSEEVRRKIISADVIEAPRKKLVAAEHVCMKCASKILPPTSSNDTNKTVVIDGKSGKRVQINDSYCHPEMIPKHSTLVKVLGSIGNVLTIGVAYMTIGTPGIFNSEEKCINCAQAPGKPGCLKFGANYLHGYGNADISNKIVVNHSYEPPRLDIS